MNFSALKNALERLEASFQGNQFHDPSGVPSGKAIYAGNANVQFFGLDQSLAPQNDAPIVVVIGINYSQMNPAKPTQQLLPLRGSNTNVAAVCTRWGAERGRLDLCFKHYAGNPCLWVANGLASTSSIPVPPKGDYLLAATNFCGWITNEKWTQLGAAYGSGVPWDILANPPHKKQNVFDHLDQLATTLTECELPTIWVGHGLTSEAGCLARLFFQKGAIERWLLVPNLSSWHQFYDESSGIIKFGKGPR